MKDDELIKLYLKGDHDSFIHLYERHKGGVYRYLLRQLNEPSMVEDLFQEVWGKVINKLSSYASDASFKTWLYTIARHQLIDHIRHIKVVDRVIDGSSEFTEENHSNSMSPDQLHTTSMQKNAINHCLDKLPMHQKDCFLLKEETGLSAKQIAIIVNAGLEATKSRLRSAYSNLYQCLKVQLGVDGQGDIKQGGEYDSR